MSKSQKPSLDKNPEQTALMLGKILEDSLNEIYIFDTHSLKFLLANRGARNNSGYSMEELLELTPIVLKPGFTPQSFTTLLEPLLKGKKDAIQFETIHKRKDGTLYPAEVHIQCADYESKPAYVAIILDISARKSAEVALRKSEINAQAVLDNAVEGVINIDAKGTVLGFNKAAESIFGYKAAEVIGHNVNMLMPEPYHKAHDSYLERYLSTGQRRIIGIGREVRGLRKNGDEFPLDLSVAETMVGNERSFTGITRDLTERKVIEQRLKQQSEEARKTHEQLAHISRLTTMGEMAAGIAHEINQPLTAIATYAQAAKRLLEANNMDELNSILGKIDIQAQRAGEVIRRLRTLVSRQDSKRNPVNMNDLIMDTLALLHNDISTGTVTVNTELDKTLPLTEVDSIQIQQVIINLIRNSMDAMESQANKTKAITVKTTIQDQDNIKIIVKDNGEGVNRKELDELFNPFYTTKKSGMGMGLSISRSIITTHGGQLKYNPEYKEGAEFYFILPMMSQIRE